MGWALIISSVSIDIKFRKYMLVGWAKLSWRLIVGKTTGRAPDSIIPRSSALIKDAILPWHGLKPDEVSMIPMIARSRALSVYPAPLMNALRKKRENASSPLLTQVKCEIASSKDIYVQLLTMKSVYSLSHASSHSSTNSGISNFLRYFQSTHSANSLVILILINPITITQNTSASM